MRLATAGHGKGRVAAGRRVGPRVVALAEARGGFRLVTGPEVLGNCWVLWVFKRLYCWVSVVRPGENAALWPCWLIPFGNAEEFGGREIHHFDGRSQDFLMALQESPNSPNNLWPPWNLQLVSIY